LGSASFSQRAILMGALGNRLEKLIAERNAASVELRKVNTARFKLECRLDKLTTYLAAMVNLRLFGDPPPDPFSSGRPGRGKVLR
jgi:hypothetical protein